MGAHNPNYTPSTWGGDMLKNRVCFTFFFLEMVSWFWVWVTLREERYELVMRMRKEEGKEQRGEKVLWRYRMAPRSHAGRAYHLVGAPRDVGPRVDGMYVRSSKLTHAMTTGRPRDSSSISPYR